MTRFERKQFTLLRHQFIRSPKWKEFREYLLQKRGRICERCGNNKRGLVLQIHHNYLYKDIEEYKDVYGHEEDLIICCKGCHRELEKDLGHPEREAALEEYYKRRLLQC